MAHEGRPMSRQVSEACMPFLVSEAAKNAQEKKREGYNPSESIGRRIGERLAARQARGHAYSSDPLDVVKFLCKIIWPAAFGKTVDNLKTNHRGVFVLQDQKMPWIQRASSSTYNSEVKDEIDAILAVASGIARGALEHMGLKCSVQAEVTEIPACTFDSI